MPIWWNTCKTCGDSFAGNSPGATDCGNRRKHDQLRSGQSRRKDDKKDEGKK